MIERPFWLQRLEDAWHEAPIAWLCGVRRCGKTTLAESLGAERIVYVNCDLPIVEDRVRDPVVFFRSCAQPVVVFDEIHQLRDPARVLKIGADGFSSRLKIRDEWQGEEPKPPPLLCAQPGCGNPICLLLYTK